MAIVMCRDSDNTLHQLWAQDQAATCAVASFWMARNQAKQMTVNQSEWALAWGMYQRVVQGMSLAPSPAPAPMSLDPRAHQNNQTSFGNMFSQAGTYMSQVAQVLRSDGLSVTHLTGFAPGTTVQAARLSETTPAIVLLGWYNGANRAGGHFIVASRVTRAGRIVYLDPWGGRLSEMGGGPQYQGTGMFEQVLYLSS